MPPEDPDYIFRMFRCDVCGEVADQSARDVAVYADPATGTLHKTAMGQTKFGCARHPVETIEHPMDFPWTATNVKVTMPPPAPAARPWWRWRRWVVEINPMGLGLWSPVFEHWFRWTAERRAARMRKAYECEARVSRQ